MGHFLPQVDSEQPARDLAKPAALRIFHQERFYNAIPGERLVHNVGHVRKFPLIGTAQVAEPAAEPDRGIEHERD